MIQIGHFTRLRGLYTGRIRTLTMDVHVVLAPTNAADPARQPAYTIHLNDADGPEVGAAWRKSSERAGEYLSLSLDCPGLPASIAAKLFQHDQDKKVWTLVWARSPKRDEGAG